MSIIKSIVCITVLLFCLQAKAQFSQLIWSDEFDGTTINRANWVFEYGNNYGWGNNELQYYTNRPDNATVKDGKLLIIAKKENYGGASYTSARMKTQGLQEFTYGKIEARIKFPMGQGIWPAFWMLGKNISQAGVGWPKCGEIDIMEHINNEKIVHGTIHWDDNRHVQYGLTTSVDVSQYHVYGIEWDSKAIKWFVDGRKYVEANIANNINSTEEFHAPFFILLNLAVGGNWPKNPDATTLFPDTLFVDYVRVYGLTTGTSSIDAIDSKGISHNYPNPFYPKTTISFNIPIKSVVSLKVYDSVGKEVAVLESKELAAGNYKRPWNATGLPAGVYYYQLQAGKVKETRKLILQR